MTTLGTPVIRVNVNGINQLAPASPEKKRHLQEFGVMFWRYEIQISTQPAVLPDTSTLLPTVVVRGYAGRPNHLHKLLRSGTAHATTPLTQATRAVSSHGAQLLLYSTSTHLANG